MKKIILILVCCFNYINVNAAENLVRTPVDNMYYVGVNSEKSISYQYKLYDIGGVEAYCIEPGVDITTDIYYGSEDLVSSSGISFSKIKEMSLYAYYGDGYKNHDSSRYRAATQLLIWEVLDIYDFTFYTGPNGTGEKIDLSKEMNEIRKLVDIHTKYPSFVGDDIHIKKGETVVLEDLNNMLDNFYVSYTSGLTTSIENNKLSINSTFDETKSIYFKTISHSDNPILIQHNGSSQKMLTRGEAYLNSFSIKVSTYETNVNINKYGERMLVENNSFSYSNVLLEDVKFNLYAGDDIYDSLGNLLYTKDNLILSYVTNESGNITLDNLYYGKYYIKEDNLLDEYIVNDQIYSFELDKNNLNVNIDVNNYLKKGILEILKTDSLTREPLKGVVFEVYNDKDEIVYVGTSDENGFITINNLMLGNYYIKELNVLEGYVKNEKIIAINLDRDIYNINITNDKLIGIPDTYSYEHKNLFNINVYYEKKKYI